MTDLVDDYWQVVASASTRPTIDASLGVGMVGGVKAVILLLVVFCAALIMGCRPAWDSSGSVKPKKLSCRSSFGQEPFQLMQAEQGFS